MMTAIVPATTTQQQQNYKKFIIYDLQSDKQSVKVLCRFYCCYCRCI